jgi:hypothetical protein
MTRTLVAVLAVSALPAFSADRITEEQRIELVRNLTAEYATVKESLPRSRKPLELETNGKYDQQKWVALMRQAGPAARLGDQVQLTKITIENERIVFEINGGIKSGKHWYDNVSVGMGTSTTPVGHGDATATTGTYVSLEFHKPIGEIDTAEVKKMLAPLFDFDKHTVTQLFSDTLSPEVKKAIAEKRARVGMNRDEVLLALGHADRKLRETKDGDETEDWIYGHPPGKIVFVTFNGDKVIKVNETYAGLGVEAAKPLEVPR